MKKAWLKPLVRKLAIDLTAGNKYGYCDPANPHFNPSMCAS